MRSRYETWMVPSQMTSKGTLSSWSRSCSQFGKLNRAALFFFNFSVTWHSALVQCLQEKKCYTILRSARGRGVDVSVFLLFLCRDCCYDNKKLKTSYPVKPVFSAKPAPVNLWNILGRKKIVLENKMEFCFQGTPRFQNARIISLIISLFTKGKNVQPSWTSL